MQNKFLQPNIFSDEWTREVFNHHNKEYGAFQLRRLYNYRMSTAFLISVTVIASLLIFYYSIKLGEPIINCGGVIVEPGLPPVVIDHRVKPQIETALNKRHIESAPIAISKDSSFQDTTHVERKTTNSNSGNGTDTSASKSIIGNSGKKAGGDGNSNKISTAAKDTVVTWAREMPEFPGGMDALNKFVSKKIKTNSYWIESGTDGKVVYQFVVGRDGNVRDIKIMKDGVSYGLAELNLSLFDEMPQWKPGKNNGHTVSILFYLPVKFIKE